MGDRHDCFAQATPGLEALVADELVRLGVRPGRLEPGGVAFRATTRQLYAANLWLRCANRVLVRAAELRATTFAGLERRLGDLAWDTWLGADVRPVFRVSSTRSALYHTEAVAERFARAVGQRPDVDGPEQLVVVRLVDDRVVVSLDSSGDPLHRRGWRRAGAKAPLRETLAAAVVAASGWDGEAPLADPLCGSGTIAIEAALRARDAAPGLGRDFALQRWPGFEPGTWGSVLGEARARLRPPGGGPEIVGADRDAGAIRAARANAEGAGVAGDVAFHCRSLSAFPALGAGRAEGSSAGWIVTNPPYGARLTGGRADLRDLYAVLGRVIGGRPPGDGGATGGGRAAGGRRKGGGGPTPPWAAALLVADPVLAGHTGLRLEERLRTTNGGLPVRLLVSPAGIPPGRTPPAPPARPARRPGARRAAGPDPAGDRRPPPAGRTG